MPQDRQELRDFLLRACHDLRTPVRAVKASAELLVKAPEKRDGPELEQILGFITNGARSIDSLVDGLSDYALALTVERNALPVPTGVLLRSVLAKLAADIRASDAEITYDDLPPVPGDPDRLMQLFENLLRNAIQQRGEAPPRIHVGARQEGGQWIFAVRDNGQGIAEENLERIFRPFERLQRNQGSAGLGLAICREIVAGHGGRIWAESVMGAGAAFYFSLEIE